MVIPTLQHAQLHNCLGLGQKVSPSMDEKVCVFCIQTRNTHEISKSIELSMLCFMLFYVYKIVTEAHFNNCSSQPDQIKDNGSLAGLYSSYWSQRNLPHELHSMVASYRSQQRQNRQNKLICRIQTYSSTQYAVHTFVLWLFCCTRTLYIENWRPLT